MDVFLVYKITDTTGLSGERSLKMTDFKVIETQEQLDAVIGERIKRERETIAKRYEGFISPDELQTQTAELTAQIGNLTKSLEEANTKITNHDKELANRDKKIKEYESHSVKSRIAHENGLSYEAINFLQGDDEESIRKSAESLKSLVGKADVPPLANHDDNQVENGDAALLTTIRNLNEKGE